MWQVTNVLQGNMDTAEHKHVVLRLIFLKYISDSFELKRAALKKVMKEYTVRG